MGCFLALEVPQLLSSVREHRYTGGSYKENVLHRFKVSTSATLIRVLAADVLEFGFKIAVASGELRHVVVNVDIHVFRSFPDVRP